MRRILLALVAGGAAWILSASCRFGPAVPPREPHNETPIAWPFGPHDAGPSHE